MARERCRPGRGSAALTALLVLLAWPAVSLADKSGVRPNVIDLPRGPGSVSGLGEQFEPSLNTGSARYEVRLQTPPGTAGLAPALALRYDSGQGNGPLGIGWSLDAGAIQRQTDKGVPRYEPADRFLADGKEIVPVGGGAFRYEIEEVPVRFRQSAGGHWEADGPDGTVSRYGVSAAARVEGPGGTFRWALEQVADLSGNRILYSYEQELGQLYLVRIDYNARAGAARNAVLFDYEPRSDALSDCRAGFCVTTGRRLRQVRMVALDRPVRRYLLEYEPAAPLSRLQRVTLFGSDDVTALPPATFGYTAFEPGRPALAELANPPAFGLHGDPDTELLDFDGDGLPDLLHTDPVSGDHAVAWNRGGAWSDAEVVAPGLGLLLQTNGIEVADLDGDGRADLVAKLAPGAGDFSFRPNAGAGRWEPPVACRNAPDFSLEDSTVRLLDLDGDGLVDALQTTASGYYFWRNAGGGSWAAPATLAPVGSPPLLFSDSQVKLADMNGDRLVDLVQVRAGSVVYFPSLGHGAFGAMVPLAGAPDAGPDQARVQLADLDGDGLADLWLASGTGLRIWLQRGDGRFAAPLAIAGMPEANPLTTTVRTADLDGSGTADVVWNCPGCAVPWQVLDLAGGVRPNLLVRVENGLGRLIEIDYGSTGGMAEAARAAGRPWARKLPIAMQVVASHTVSDGRGWASRRTYTYRDGHYDGATRQFRGFGQTRVVEVGDGFEATSVRVHDFDVGLADAALKGVPIQDEVRDEAGGLYRRDRFGHEVRQRAAGIDGRRVRSAERRWHEVDHVERAAAPATTREEWSYDEWGGVLVHSAWGVVEDGDLLARGDERITSTEYAHDPGRWLLGKATRALVTDAAGTRLTESLTYYDGPAFLGLPLGQLGERGLVTRREAWVEGTRFAQVERRQLDAFGLTVATLDALGTRHELEHDPGTHCYPVAERSLHGAGRALALGAEYDLALGTLLAFTDAAGAVTRFRWDALGHLAAIVKPGDSEARPTVSFEIRYGSPLTEVVARRRVEAGRDETVERHHWHDGLGRLLATVEEAEGGRTVVGGLKRYGPQGRAVAEHEPLFQVGYALPESLASPVTQHRYDPLGREVRTELPDGSASERRHAPLAVEHWDAEDLDPASAHAGTPRIERSSGQGVVEVEERLGTAGSVTRFERDALGRVARVVDALGRVSTWHRDGLGRVAESIHSAAGRTAFLFDDAGNLRERRDARGALVATDYDELSRPREERLFDAAGNLEERTAYHYDDPSPLFPDDAAEGELAWVEDGAGEEHYRRDPRGRLVELVRIVDGKAYRLQTRYDDQDRVARVVYPSGRALELRYGPRGLLQSVPGVIRAIEYDARGLATRREHENGAVTTATYDDLDRLATLRTVSGGRTLQALGYRYDRVGSLLGVTDGLGRAGVLAAARSYGYDDLYRLVTAEGAGRNWSYAYDAAGGFDEKSDIGAYLPAGAEQPATIGSQAYRHDAAGNCVERPGSRQAFDARGRLKEVSLADGTEVRYRYDYTGARVVKESRGPRGNHRTVHADKLSEERDGEMSDYVFAGAARVARLGGALPGPVAALLGMVPPAFALGGLLFLALAALASLARGLRRRARPAWALGAACALLSLLTAGCGGQQESVGSAAGVHFHGDHLSGLSVVTGAGGELVSEAAYEPFGQRLQGTSEPYAFGGKEYEADTGLYDFGARAYDPVAGRFLSPDPAVVADPELGVEDPQGLHPYAYARNRPTSLVDPDGRWAHVVLAAVGGAVRAGAEYAVKAAATGDFSGRELGAVMAGGAVREGVRAALAVAGPLVSGAAAEVAAGIVERGIRTGDVHQAFDAKAIAGDAVSGLGGGLQAKLQARLGGAVKAEVAGGRGGGSARRAGSYGELRAAGVRDAHHTIQDAAVRDLPGYRSSAAPAVQLPGPSTSPGTPHYAATQVQRQAGGGTYAAERRIGYKAMRRAGLSPEEARENIGRADAYFESLGVTAATPTRIPGNR